MKRLLTIAIVSVLAYTGLAQTGKVGVNTTTPTATLDVKSLGNTAATNAVKVTNSSNTEIITVTDDGKMGIGSTTPTHKLDVNGNVKVLTPGGSYISGMTGTAGISGTDQTATKYHPFLRQKTSSGHFVNLGGYRDWFGLVGYDKARTVNGFDHTLIMNLETGNVGIGTVTPGRKLEVNGLMRTKNQYGFIDIGAQNVSYAHFMTDMPQFYFQKKLIVDEGIIRSHNEDLKLGTNTGDAIVVKQTSGNVGVGIAAPSQKLDVNGGTRLRSLPTAGSSETVNVVVADATGVLKSRAISTLVGPAGPTGPTGAQGPQGPAGSPSTASNGLTKVSDDIRLGGTLTQNTNINQNGNNLTTSGTGNVGIGTTNPSQKLEVNGRILSKNTHGSIDIGAQNASYAHFMTDMPQFYFQKKLVVDEGIVRSHNEDLKLGTAGGNAIVVDATTGNVGIGNNISAAPSTTLDVHGTIKANNNGATTVHGIMATATSDEPADFDQEIVFSANPSVAKVDRTSIFIAPSPQGALSDRGRVQVFGNVLQLMSQKVGVGVSTPAEKLDVGGNVKINGVTLLKAQAITANGACTSGSIGYSNNGDFYACKGSQWKQLQLAQ